MKPLARAATALLVMLTLLVALTVPAFAAGLLPDHPPIFTVLTSDAPRDMDVTIELQKNGEIIPIKLERNRRFWETHYFLRREATIRITAWYGNPYDLKDAVLVFEAGDEIRRLPVTDDMLSSTGQQSEDYVFYRWKNNSLTAGLPPLRAPLLFLLWIAVALAVESVVFRLYGYRRARSWLAFLILNLITQSIHHMIIAGLFLRVERLRLYIMSAPLVFLIELPACIALLNEQKREKAISFALTANLASQIVLALLIGHMPA
ncbi:MAG: hypothetical protein IKH56_10500 [Oscillospiraceae bacterium]|nr:hypothetical protein [Oscillospiraceae bacterium]